MHRVCGYRSEGAVATSGAAGLLETRRRLRELQLGKLIGGMLLVNAFVIVLNVVLAVSPRTA